MAAPAAVDPGIAPVAPDPAPAATQQTDAQPAVTPESAASAADQARGPIPFDRHESILKNAREKTEKEITDRFTQQYGAHVELGRRISADPVGTIVGLFENLAQHPDHGATVRSALGRMLGMRQQSAPAAEDAEPQPDFQSGDGTPFYSAPQQAKREAWLRKQLDQSIEQRLQPLQQERAQRVAAEREAQAKSEAGDRVTKMLAPYKQMLPDFDKHKPVLLEKVQGYLKDGYDAQTALGLSVLHVVNSTVMPARAAESQQQLVAQAVAKATGATTPPGAVSAAAAKRPQSFEEGFSGIRI